MPVIPATWEVERGGWWFEASLGQKMITRPYLKNKLGMVVHILVISAMQGEHLPSK
jgi:hypothetical protein